MTLVWQPGTVSPATAYVLGLGIVTDGLVLNLDAGTPLSYPGTGTTWTDLSGYGNNGTLVNGVGYTADNGGALTFDGVDDYVTGNITLGITNVSINCWVNISTTSKKGAFLKVGEGAAGYATGVGNNVMDVNGNEIIAVFPGIRWIDTNTNYGTGWKYVTLVLNASSVPSIYVNSTLIGSFPGNTPNSPGNAYYIGRSVGDEPVGVRAFNGNIAQVSIYNKALTASEITQNYNALKGRYGL
jgi:hypothetical protein